MFAKQMAVMKGQAWNVVETLKQPDHGPLELTRRTRVCVWDDRVEIPVAIPMRAPSNDAHRRRARERNQDDSEDEIDISTASNAQPSDDLIRLGSPPGDLPNPNRFELARDRGSEDEDRGLHDRDSQDLARSWASAPPRTRSNRPGGHSRHSSRSSITYRRGSWVFDGDDLEGDLGYAAAEGMEGTERTVIVERLETVKSSNPIFTGC